MREGHSGWSDWTLSVLMVLSAVSCLHQLSCVDSNVSGNVLIRGCEVDQSVRHQCAAFVSQSVTSSLAQGFKKNVILTDCYQYASSAVVKDACH